VKLRIEDLDSEVGELRIGWGSGINVLGDFLIRKGVI